MTLIARDAAWLHCTDEAWLEGVFADHVRSVEEPYQEDEAKRANMWLARMRIDWRVVRNDKEEWTMGQLV